MLFTEPAFLFYFLPVLLALHCVAGQRGRNALLLSASLLFYAWGEPAYVLILLFSIAFNFASGRAAARSRAALAFGLTGNLVLLGAFKYLGFALENLNPLLEVLGLPRLALQPLALPIGISFYTFQAMSYLVDVHRGQVRPQGSPIDLALYIAMFPQLVAGPIVRYRDIEPQLRGRVVTRAGFAEGVQRFVIGLGKKMLLANSLAVPADQVFALPAEAQTAGLAWLAAVCYALQIYYDFSGYSDMAIGLGRMFGFHFRENFAHPYSATGVRDFWRRWHISLSSWFRDYLYIPLGGGRQRPLRVYANLWIVFLLCGAWHGASWNFVLWGAWHGLFLVLERARGVEARAPGAAPLRRLYVLAVVLVGWVIFRAETLPDAVAVLLAMGGLGAGDGLAWNAAHFLDSSTLLALAAGLLGAASAPVAFLRRRVRGLPPVARGAAAGLQLAGLVAVFVSCCARIAAGTYNPFIYFRF